MASNKLRLLYFPVRARAESLRMMMAFGKVSACDGIPLSSPVNAEEVPFTSAKR